MKRNFPYHRFILLSGGHAYRKVQKSSAQKKVRTWDDDRASDRYGYDSEDIGSTSVFRSPKREQFYSYDDLSTRTNIPVRGAASDAAALNETQRSQGRRSASIKNEAEAKTMLRGFSISRLFSNTITRKHERAERAPKIEPPVITEKHLHMPTKRAESMFMDRTRPRSFVLSVFFSSLSMFFVLLLMVGCAGLGAVIGIAKAYVVTTPVLDLGLIENQAQTSSIYDVNGKLITTFAGIENREWVKYEDIPDMLSNAFVAVEDVRFFKHKGVDYKRLFGAVINTLRNQNTHGGSTITQQLIKNRVLTNEVSYKRKIQEAYLATELEGQYKKTQILEAYLNAIHLGESNYGIKAAAEDYFGKELKDLTIRECAMLAGLTQNPYWYNPRKNMYIRHDFKRTDDRTNDVLQKMYEAGFITKEQLASALEETVPILEKSKQKELYDMPYFVEYAVYDVTTHLLKQRELQDNKANRALIENEIRTGGYKIYTTVDTSMQNTLQTTLAQWTDYPKLRDPIYNIKIAKNADGTITEVPQPQAAAVIIDYHTGEIKALVGGRYPPERRKELNRAYQGRMPVGSSIKPIAVYGPALDAGASPGTIVNNVPLPIPGWGGLGYPYLGADKYLGPISIRTGVKMSLNNVAARTLFNLTTPQISKEYLVRLGIDPSRINVDGPGLALGTSGITPLEMTAAFGAIANEGVYVEPLAFSRVLDSKGNIILDAGAIRIKRQVFKPSTSWLLTDMLTDAVKGGTGTKAKIAGMSVAGKTGTNDDYRSVYFAGYTPYYASAIWIGHDDYKPQLKSGTTGGDYAAPLWQAYMSKIHTGLSDKSIMDKSPQELGLVQRKVCAVSGMLATAECEHDADGLKPITDWFPIDAVPTESCTWHVDQRICTISGKLATQYCPADAIKTSSVLIVPSSSELALLDTDVLKKALPHAIVGSANLSMIDSLTPGTVEYYNYYCSIHTSASYFSPQSELNKTLANARISEAQRLMNDSAYIISNVDRNLLYALIGELQNSMDINPESSEFAVNINKLSDVIDRIKSENMDVLPPAGDL